MASPDELLRIVQEADGTLAIGRSRPGRGAWLHAACMADAQRRNAFTRAFRAPVAVSAVAELSEAIAGVCEDRELHPDEIRRD